MSVQTDIIIAGAGPTGLAAALEAAKCGYDVVIAAPKGTFLDDDGRTTALMQPGIAMLKEYGVWPDCEPASAPLKTLRIIDSTNRLFRAPPVSFRASEAGLDAFGYNIPNRILNAAIEKAVKANGTITVVDAMVSAVSFHEDRVEATLCDGTEIVARLVVGADGTRSSVRQAASIEAHRWTWPQTAVVAAFDHERSHQFISTEYHTAEGPFTQVPLPGQRSSLVWLRQPAKAEATLTLDDRALATAIEHGLQSTLGKISNVTRPQLWPMSSLVARRFGSRRAMLIGQAAHAFPPIGAQGLNLGFRDVADLARVLAKAGGDPGAQPITGAYDRRRRLDVYTRTGAVDLLNRSLLSGILPVQMMRAAGLSVLRDVGPLRGLMMREGVAPGSSLKAIGACLWPKAPPTGTDRGQEARSSSDTAAA